jgi:hypothetical protein
LGIVFALCALAGAACSKGMLMSDVGTVTGGSGANGAGGRAGAGGSGGFACTAADVFMACDVDVAAPPVPGTAGAPCSDDGAHCEGYSCASSSGFAWEATCCFGVWLNYAGPCPALADTARGPSP